MSEMKHWKRLKLVFTNNKDSLLSSIYLACSAFEKGFVEVVPEYESALFILKKLKELSMLDNTLIIIVKNLPPEVAPYAREEYKREAELFFLEVDRALRERGSRVIFWLKDEFTDLERYREKGDRVNFLYDEEFFQFWGERIRVEESILPDYEALRRWYVTTRDERVFLEIFPGGVKECGRRLKKPAILKKLTLDQPEDDYCVIQAKITPAIVELKNDLQKIALNDETVFIYGETGTGKECVAQSIFYLRKVTISPKGKFVALNCAAIPPDLLESELFGYEKGAFTGAESSKKGLVEEASGGVLFLDEIDKMPISLQAKLLRFIQSGKFRKVGGTEEKKVKNVKIISASNMLPETAIKDGKLLPDLFHRLSTFILRLPPLREWHSEDKLRLINNFVYGFTSRNRFIVEEYLRKKGKEELAERESLKGFYYTIIPKPVIQSFLSHPWNRGNAREMKKVILRYVTLERKLYDEDIFKEGGTPLTSGEKFFSVGIDSSNPPALKEIERLYARYVFELTGRNKKKTASILDVSQPTLNKLLKEE